MFRQRSFCAHELWQHSSFISRTHFFFCSFAFGPTGNRVRTWAFADNLLFFLSFILIIYFFVRWLTKEFAFAIFPLEKKRFFFAFSFFPLRFDAGLFLFSASLPLTRSLSVISFHVTEIRCKWSIWFGLVHWTDVAFHVMVLVDARIDEEQQTSRGVSWLRFMHIFFFFFSFFDSECAETSDMTFCSLFRERNFRESKHIIVSLSIYDFYSKWHALNSNAEEFFFSKFFARKKVSNWNLSSFERNRFWSDNETETRAVLNSILYSISAERRKIIDFHLSFFFSQLFFSLFLRFNLEINSFIDWFRRKLSCKIVYNLNRSMRHSLRRKWCSDRQLRMRKSRSNVLICMHTRAQSYSNVKFERNEEINANEFLII